LFPLSIIFGASEREIPKFWSDVQFSKHLIPILTTEFGIMKDDNDEHPEKQPSPID
jgi:hypothetical protein